MERIDLSIFVTITLFLLCICVYYSFYYTKPITKHISGKEYTCMDFEGIYIPVIKIDDNSYECASYNGVNCITNCLDVATKQNYDIDAIKNGDTIYIKNIEENRYCSDDPRSVICKMDSQDIWLNFTIHKVGGENDLIESNDIVEIKGSRKGYCTVELDEIINCNRRKTTIGGKFEIIKYGTNTETYDKIKSGDVILLKSLLNNNYCGNRTELEKELKCDQKNIIQSSLFIISKTIVN